MFGWCLVVNVKYRTTAKSLIYYYVSGRLQWTPHRDVSINIQKETEKTHKQKGLKTGLIILLQANI